MEDRSKGIGGSDIAAIVGLSPWKTPFDVYAEKLGLVEPTPDNPAMKWGRALEPVVAEAYAEQEGVTLAPAPLIVSTERPWQRGTPDRLIVERGGDPLEIKTANVRQAHRWGEPGSDQIPEEYFAQVSWYLSLTGRENADVAVLIGGSDFRVYRLERDLELEVRLLEAAERFWKDHVLAEEPPPIDGGRAAAEYLRSKYPRHTAAMRKATDADWELARRLAKARERFDVAEAAKESIENGMKLIIGDSEGIDGGSWKVTWRAAKDSVKTDWQAVAKELSLLVPDEKLDGLLAKHTETKPGSRRFLVTFEEGFGMIEGGNDGIKQIGE